MWTAILAIGKWLLGLIFGGSKNAPSAEAVAAANGAQAKVNAAVSEETASTEARMAQAVVDAPQTKAGLEADLRKGDF